MKKILTFAAVLCLVILGSSSSLLSKTRSNKEKANAWADSLYKTMSPKERLGQLFMVAAYSNRDEKHISNLEKLIKDNGIGGLIFFQGGPGRQARICNRLQAASKVPLLIAMDAEWGLSMRLDSTPVFPRQMTLGAGDSVPMVFRMGSEMAWQCKRLGVHLSFSPVADINSNPSNPVIGMRSFGQDKNLVARLSVAYMKGLQQNGVLANAKHFPGHGDAGADSHYELPVISRTQEELEQMELFPFRALFEEGVSSVMNAHLAIPALDNRKNRPSTLSYSVISKLLRKKLGFKGLAFTDALNMKGVAKYFKPGELEVEALAAGNDVMLFPEDVPAAIKAIEEALDKGYLKESRLKQSIIKILEAKYEVGLNEYSPIKTEGLYEDLNLASTNAFIRQLYASSATLVRDKAGAFPFNSSSKEALVAISIGSEEVPADLNTMIESYSPVQHLKLGAKPKDLDFNFIAKKAGTGKRIIISLLGVQGKPNKQFGILPGTAEFIKGLAATNKVVVLVFGNPYSLQFLPNDVATLVMYEDNVHTRELAPQILFGAMAPTGKLPVTAAADCPYKLGKTFDKKTGSLRYDFPENLGFNTKWLQHADELANRLIKEKAAPGCQIAFAHNGVVFYRKSFGKTIYDSGKQVTHNTLYDIASVTKVAATTQAAMQLYSEKKLNLKSSLSEYLPELTGNQKGRLLIEDVLTHRTGLPATMLTYQKLKTGKKSLAGPKWYSDTLAPGYEIALSDSLFARTDVKDSLWKWLLNTKELPLAKGATKPEVLYSDLNMVLMQKVIERISGTRLDSFLENGIYSEIGLSKIGYNCIYGSDSGLVIAPTEYDSLWRKTLVLARVHDELAALMGGVSGNAGLFSNSTDLIRLLEYDLAVQNNKLKSNRLSVEAINDFTKSQPGTIRGLGWNKSKPGATDGAASYLCSSSSYGHSGFTGTLVWADPELKLSYVFLSNRVYPTRTNQKLLKGSYRTRIQDCGYKAIEPPLPLVYQTSSL